MKRIWMIGIGLWLGWMPAAAQLIGEKRLTWNGDGLNESVCNVRIYKALTHETRGKTHVAVLQELAENKGRSAMEDAKHLAEIVGQTFSLNPEETLFVFHIGGFTFESGKGKRQFLWATAFKRQENGKLTPPSWRFLAMEDLLAFTDRQFRVSDTP